MIRNTEDRDTPRIEEIYAASGLPANCMPHLDSPLFIVKKVIEKDGEVTMLGAVRITCEAYLLVDHTKGTPEERLENLKELAREIEMESFLKGLDDCSVFVAPEVATSFGKRLEQLGFVRTNWPVFSKELKCE